MRSALAACFKTHLRFAWRNRLPVAVGLFMLLLMLLMSVPAFLVYSSAKRFELLKQLIANLDGFAYWFIAAVGLLTLSHHLRTRSVKMVLTKPCPVEIWLLSTFLAPLAIAAVLYGGILLIGLALCALWGLPVVNGLCFVVANGFCRAAMMCGYLLLLTALWHPVVAVMVVLFVQEQLFYYLALWLAAWHDTAAAASKNAIGLLAKLVTALYYVAPSYAPFQQGTADVHNTYRIGSGDLQSLGLTALYALSLSLLCFLLATAALKHKQLT